MIDEESPLAVFAAKVADDVALRIAELPDRDSPDDQPEMMLVTAQELRDIIGEAIERATSTPRSIA